MFATFNYVAGALYEYDEGKIEGLHVDFANRGVYYDPSFGNNWWEYFCAPIRLGASPTRLREITARRFVTLALFTEYQLSREQVHHLIESYIHINPTILKKVENFVQKNFSKEPVIGVHYRGTDKHVEAAPVRYQTVLQEIHRQIDGNPKIKLFVATDEQAFYEYLCSHFSDRVISYASLRSCSKKPLHTLYANRYLQGEEALIDCLLLSKTDHLIRTSSNLSLWSTYFNPKLPVTELNQRKRPLH